MSLRSARRPGALLSSALVAGAVAVAGCGSDTGSAGGGGSPAAVVPATAPVYAEVVVRPDRDLAADLEAAGSKLTGRPDAGRRLVALIDRGLARQHKSFAQDVEPWLGDRVGVALTRVSPTRADAAVVATVTDEAKARDAVADQGSERRYHGATYRLKEGTASGVIGDRLVVGDERAVKAIVDAQKDGRVLETTKALRQARADVQDDRLGFAYVDGRALLRTVAASSAATTGTGVAGATAQQLLSQIKLGAIGMGLDVDPGTLRVEGAARGAGATLAGASAAGSIADLPAGSLAAVGVGDVGQTLRRGLDQLGSGVSGIVLGQLQTVTGLDVQRDVLGWMGKGGLVVRGGSEPGGALVVASKDPAATRRFVTKLRALVPRFAGGTKVRDYADAGASGFELVGGARGQTVIVAAGHGRFAVGVGRRAVREVLNPSGRLADDDRYKQAAGKLGRGFTPSALVDLHGLIGLAAPRGGSTSGYQQAKPYLDALGTLVVGARSDGAVQRSQAVVTLR